MDSTDLYHQILGLNSNWQVSEVKLEMAAKKVEIFVKYVKTILECPECGKACPGYDKANERRWRHLDTCQMQTIIHSQLPRINCSEHGVKTIKCPWAEPHGRFTLFFEAIVINLMQACKNQTRAANFLGITFDQANAIMQRAVVRGLSRRDKNEIHEHLGVDEKSMKRKHTYITVLSNSETGAAIDVSEGRTIKATDDLYTKCLSKNQLFRIKTVTMDMWESFYKATAKAIPQALIIHDRFHIAGYLTGMVDKTRISEVSKYSELKGQKYNLTRNIENLSQSSHIKFTQALKVAQKTAEAYVFKEAFREFFAVRNYKEAKTFLKKWCTRAYSTGNRHVIKVSKMIRNHKNRILNYIRSQRTNAMAENLNGRIQEVKFCARGFRRFLNFRNAILFFCGQLDMNPLKTQ